MTEDWTSSFQGNCSKKVPTDGEVFLKTQPLLIALNIVIIVLTASVNSTIICIFFVMKMCKHRKFSELAILQLAVADLCVGVMSMPLSMLADYNPSFPKDDDGCFFTLFLQTFFCLLSGYTVLLITIDRYLMCVWPLEYRKQCDRRVMWLLLLLPGAAVILLDAVPLVTMYAKKRRRQCPDCLPRTCYLPNCFDRAMLSVLLANLFILVLGVPLFGALLYTSTRFRRRYKTSTELIVPSKVTPLSSDRMVGRDNVAETGILLTNSNAFFGAHKRLSVNFSDHELERMDNGASLIKKKSVTPPGSTETTSHTSHESRATDTRSNGDVHTGVGCEQSTPLGQKLHFESNNPERQSTVNTTCKPSGQQQSNMPLDCQSPPGSSRRGSSGILVRRDSDYFPDNPRRLSFSETVIEQGGAQINLNSEPHQSFGSSEKYKRPSIDSDFVSIKTMKKQPKRKSVSSATGSSGVTFSTGLVRMTTKKRSRTKLLIIVTLVVSIFEVLYLPFTLLCLVSALSKPSDNMERSASTAVIPRYLSNTLVWLLMSNSLLNTLLYPFFRKNFRTGFCNLIKQSGDKLGMAVRRKKRLHVSWKVHLAAKKVSADLGKSTSRIAIDQNR